MSGSSRVGHNRIAEGSKIKVQGSRIICTTKVTTPSRLKSRNLQNNKKNAQKISLSAEGQTALAMFKVNRVSRASNALLAIASIWPESSLILSDPKVVA
mmetsp:Transcript_43212/g.68342  ORF Transcript_43212/g.68342 Transcript_43212/m.68342 type:complete len:99 (-) Transcript_43212:1767-2063(-)